MHFWRLTETFLSFSFLPLHKTNTMTDKEIAKKLPTASADLPAIVGRNFQYLSDWANQNEAQFEKVMQLLATQNPAKWADVYCRALQILSVQAKTPTAIKVQHTLTEDDMSILKKLSTQRERSRKFDDFEEIKNT